MEIRRGESEIGVELTGFLPCCYYVIMNIVHERKEISLQLKSMDSSLPFDLFNNNSHLVCYRSPTGFASKILCTKTLKYWLKKITHTMSKRILLLKSLTEFSIISHQHFFQYVVPISIQYTIVNAPN